MAHRYDLYGLLAGGLILFCLGLRDDVQPLNPLVKLIGQMVSIMPFVVGAGLAFTSTTFIVSIPLVLFWVLSLTNSFNLLDNMDGLSAGTAAVVGGVLTCYSFRHGERMTGALSALVMGACLGFLWYNFRVKGPAKIFMGDCCSMFLGYMLSGLAVIAFCPILPEPFLQRAAQCLLPLLIMCVPLFDTILVIIRRKMEGRAVSQGGRDHSSHRLVYAGCSDKQAVLLLWGVSLLGGSAALVLDRMRSPLFPLSTGLTLLLGAIALTAFGVYLSRFTGSRQVIVNSSRVDTSRIETSTDSIVRP